METFVYLLGLFLTGLLGLAMTIHYFEQSFIDRSAKWLFGAYFLITEIAWVFTFVIWVCSLTE